MEQINFVCCIPKVAAVWYGVGKAMRKLHIDAAFNKVSSDEHNFREMKLSSSNWLRTNNLVYMPVITYLDFRSEQT